MFTTEPTLQYLIVDSRTNIILVGTTNADVASALMLRRSYYRSEVDYMNNSSKNKGLFATGLDREFDKMIITYRMNYHVKWGGTPNESGRHEIETVRDWTNLDKNAVTQARQEAMTAELFYASAWQIIMHSLRWTPPENDMVIRFYPELLDAVNKCIPNQDYYVDDIIEYASITGITPKQAYNEFNNQLIPIRKQRIRAYALWQKYTQKMLMVDTKQEFQNILSEIRNNVFLGTE